MTPLLEVENLVKTFPVRRSTEAMFRHGVSYVHAVDGVTLSVGEGETVGLVGESGCGKSTLTRLVTRLIDPTSGSIRFRGEDVGAVPAEAFSHNPYRSQIQMVFQDASDSLNPRFTAFDAIADPVRRLGQDLGRRAVADRVRWAADRVGLSVDLLTRFPHQLSGGQKTRVGIARSIALDPKLLVLDEPTSSLDVSIQALILRLLDRLRGELGVSYLFVSHNLNVVRLLCDRVLVMYLGVIVEEGAAEAIFRAPRHPYTHALVSAIPEIDPALRKGKLRLPGEPLSPIDIAPNVCRFHGRCPRGDSLCLRERPILTRIGPGQRAACHYPLGQEVAVASR